jgi:hypothetical protein
MSEAWLTSPNQDPSQKFELRHDRLLIAVVDHAAWCNAGRPAATSAEPRCAGRSVREARAEATCSTCRLIVSARALRLATDAAFANVARPPPRIA